MDVEEFQGNHRYLSNFVCPSPFRFKGYTYLSVEQAYVTYKTIDYKERDLVRSLSNPGQIKRVGKTITLRKDFDFIKLNLMLMLVKRKFAANPELLQMLRMVTGNITEGNSWHDNYWGDCKCGKCRYIHGENNLGKIIMYIRDNYKC